MANCSKNTDFALCVKTELLRTGKSQKWLIEEVGKITGLYVDDSYISKIFRGKRKPPKIIKAICEILKIEER